MLTAKLSQPSFSILAVAASLVSAVLADCRAAELHVGGATVSITPDRPVALAGQMHTRVSRAVESPVTATALALESREGVKVLDLAIMVSCDLVAIEAAVLDRYFRQHQTDDYNRRKLANNTKLAMIAYGLIDREARLTPLGEKLYQTRQDAKALHSGLARHILQDLPR